MGDETRFTDGPERLRFYVWLAKRYGMIPAQVDGLTRFEYAALLALAEMP